MVVYVLMKDSEMNGGGVNTLSFGSYYGPAQTHGELLSTARQVNHLLYSTLTRVQSRACCFLERSRT